MRLFWELVKLSFQRQLTYRAANIAGILTNLFFGLLRAAVLIALYGSRTEVADLSIQAAITYTALTQALISYLLIFGWYELMDSIYTGEIAADLLKPMNYFRLWFARDIGRAVAQLLTRGLIIIFIYAMIFEISYPTSPQQWLFLALSLLLSLWVSFAWRFLVNLAAFWTPDARGIGRFAYSLVWTLSGFFLPLRLLPDWFITLAHWTPFPSMVNTSVEIYLGLLSGSDLWQALLWQLLWASLLFILGQLIMRSGVQRLVIQGG